MISHRERRRCQMRWASAVALQMMEPLLFISFCMVNVVSRTVLDAIGACDSYYTDPDFTEDRSFLQLDLRVECYTAEHDDVKAVAWGFFAVWPIGFPLLYVGLLVACRDAICTGKPSKLATATRFLWREYKPDYFWWEPLDVMRRLALSSFVLFIPAEYPMQRLLVGLLLSLLFLALVFAANPYKGRLVSAVARSLQLMLSMILIGCLAIRRER